MKKADREQRNAIMFELKRQGYGYKYIAERVGLSKETVRHYCVRSGVMGPVGGRPWTEYDYQADVERRKAIVQERLPSMEYVGEYTGSNGSAALRCKNCGAIMTRSWVAIRHGNVVCRNCEALQKQLEKEQKEKQKAARNEKREAKWWARDHEQLTFTECGHCGSLFFSERKGVKYCSARCRNAAANAASKDKRWRKIGISTHEFITLRALYNRDEGVCYLCGGKCNYEDYTKAGDVFIAGDFYPSIDHVVPLSKGGLHVWENVRLAHRRCNTLKRDNIICDNKDAKDNNRHSIRSQ